jgi:hypothetical protein
MQIGTQLVAPEGYGPLSAASTYYLLKSDSRVGRVYLIEFAKETNWRAHLVIIPQGTFECGLLKKHVRPAEVQFTLPPWLRELEGVDLTARDAIRQSKRIEHDTRIEERFQAIEPLLDDLDTLLVKQSPMACVRSVAARAGKNPERVQLWLLAYLAFGRNMAALRPAFQRVGRCRDLAKLGCKLGRPSHLHGKHHGSNVDAAMLKTILDSYDHHSKQLGLTFGKIYNKSLHSHWHCSTTKTTRLSGRPHKVVIHPDGLPFPTIGQYRYHVIKHLGREEVRKRRHGETRYRQEQQVSKGQYSAAHANLFERTQLDGYHVEEKPHAFGGTLELPTIVVVRGRCVTSGELFGIGFGFGAETRAAYRMMLFSAAVGKKYFCSLFGIEIEDEDWPCVGLPASALSDRGPAGHRQLTENVDLHAAIRSITPAYQPRAKPTIESSNPRNIRLCGAPSHLRSAHDPIGICRAEIYRTIEQNWSMDVSERLTHEMIVESVIPNPNGIFNFLDARARNDARRISIAEAVRSFATPRKFVLRDGFVYLEHIPYSSPALASSSVFDSVRPSITSHINGYILDMPLRTIWVEHEGELLDLTMQLPLDDDQEMTYLSLADLMHSVNLRKKSILALKEEAEAAKLDARQRFENEHGESIDKSRRLGGTPTGTKKASHFQTKEFKKYGSQRS